MLFFIIHNNETIQKNSRNNQIIKTKFEGSDKVYNASKLNKWPTNFLIINSLVSTIKNKFYNMKRTMHRGYIVRLISEDILTHTSFIQVFNQWQKDFGLWFRPYNQAKICSMIQAHNFQFMMNSRLLVLVN